MKNVVVLDANLSDSVFGGKTIRLLNIFGRLRKEYRLFYFPLNAGDLPDYVFNVFDNVYPIHINIEPSLIQKLYCYSQFQPAYNYLLYAGDFLKVIWEKVNTCIPLIDIDIVHVFDFYIAAVGAYAKNYLKINSDFFWDIGDSWWLMHKRKNRKDAALKDIYFERMFKHYEMGFIKHYDKTIFVGFKDYSDYPSILRQKIHLIPNGVNDSFLSYKYDVSEIAPNSLIFTGNMDYPPNRYALMHFLSDIYPYITDKVGNVVLYIVGRNGEKLKYLECSTIKVIGEVDDIKPFIAKSHIYIAPIRLGGGIKNKILEAMALGKDIVCYPEAISGFDKKLPPNVYVVDSARDFSEKVVEVLNSPPVIHNGSVDFIRNNYTWDIAIRKYKELYGKRDNTSI